MADDRQETIRETIESQIDYHLSTSDDVHEQLLSLLSVDFGIEDPPFTVLIGKLESLEDIESSEKIFLKPLLESMYSFENFKRLANDQSLSKRPMFKHLFVHIDRYFTPYFMSEQPEVCFDPWPWLEHYLNASGERAGIITEIDDPIYGDGSLMASACALAYVSLHCNLETERERVYDFLKRFEEEYGKSRRSIWCKMVLKGRIEGLPLSEILDWSTRE